MTKTALWLVMALVAAPVCAAAQAAGTAQSGQSAQSAASSASAADETLPVSLDRIRKGLATEATQDAKAKPLAPSVQGDNGVPRFSIQTEAPRTITLSDFLASTTAVPAYVRPPYDPYHYEFLEMVTPDAAKGCAQFDESACLTTYAGRFTSALAWQQFMAPGVDRVLRNIFKP